MAEDRNGKCLECGSRLTGAYCAACGQSAKEILRPFRSLLADLWDDLGGVDRRLIKTLRLLVTRPGFLSAEYLAGRRQRYTSPIKLYVGLALLGILASSWVPSNRISGPLEGTLSGAAYLQTAIGVATLLTAVEGSSEVDPFREAEATAQQWGHWVGLLLLVPLTALVMRLSLSPRVFVSGTPRTYLGIEHLVFAAHLHSFALAMMTVESVGLALLPPSGLATSIYRSVPVGIAVAYSIVAMRRFYQRTWLEAAASWMATVALWLAATAAMVFASVLAYVWLASGLG